MRRILLLPLAAIAAAGAILATAAPDRPLQGGGRMSRLPLEGVDLSAMTFTVDGDTVSREEFFRLDRARIRTLAVVPAPANLIEVETYSAAMAPLHPDSLPADVDYVVDGKLVDRSTFSSLPSSAIRSVTVVHGGRPRIIITTNAASDADTRD